jgi:hypothetical protein
MVHERSPAGVYPKADDAGCHDLRMFLRRQAQKDALWSSRSALFDPVEPIVAFV